GRAMGLEPGAEDHLRLAPQALEPLVVRDAGLELSDLGQVHARAERVAAPGQDRDAQRVVAVELHPGVVEAAQRLGVHGIALLRALHGDVLDPALSFDEPGGRRRRHGAPPGCLPAPRGTVAPPAPHWPGVGRGRPASGAYWCAR